MEFNAATVISSACIAVLAAASASGQKSTIESQSSSGERANKSSSFATITRDGRYLAFSSAADNLAAGDVNGVSDIFVRDLQSGSTELVSLSSAGVPANGPCDLPAISDDGRFVAFASRATNLVPGDTNGKFDLFVRDRVSGATLRASVSSTGTEANAHSADYPFGLYHFGPSLSADGRYVAFDSSANNLVPNDANNSMDVFVRDLQAGVTTRVSVDSSGAESDLGGQDAALSADGRYVVFGSHSTNLVAGDTNGCEDVFVHDRQSGSTTRVSVGASGGESNGGAAAFTSMQPAISGDGRFAAFSSSATNLVPGDTNGRGDVFVHERASGATERVSVDSFGAQAHSESNFPSLSFDGRYVAFGSQAKNLVTGDTGPDEDIFVRDRQSGTTTRVSVDSAGGQANGASALEMSDSRAISADGRYVVFTSAATNLVPGDPVNTDVFLRDQRPLQCGEVALYCVSKKNSNACVPSLATTGVCSASSGSGFLIQASEIVKYQDGLFFYSRTGPQWKPFFQGTLCCSPPFRRTPVQNSGATTAKCGGTFSFDFNAYIASGIDPALVPGAHVWGQYWYVDPTKQGAGLTHAFTTVICP